MCCSNTVAYRFGVGLTTAFCTGRKYFLIFAVIIRSKFYYDYSAINLPCLLTGLCVTWTTFSGGLLDGVCGPWNEHRKQLLGLIKKEI